MPLRRVPSEAVASAVRRGLRMYDAGQGGDGLRPETIRRARSIAAREAQSVRWLTVEAPAWFARHDATRPDGDTAGTPWLTAWLLWGGDPGREWVEREKSRRGRMEAAGETVMSMTIATAPGQSLGEFLEELQSAAHARLMGLVPPDKAANCWVRLEDETIDESSVVAEVCGLDEDRYYRLTYSRDESGRLVLGEPEAVEEVTTYRPIASPPMSLARGLVLESLPVHAPPVEGLTRGRQVQLLREGALYDAYTGEHLLDVTEQLCRDIATSASALGYGVPIDMGHALFRSQAGESPTLYGRLTALECKPGRGLYGTPEWTDAGAALLSANPGVYYLSPTLLGAPRDPRTGADMPGRILHSVSLTATPRQDSLDPLALSRAAAEATSLTGGADMAQQQAPIGGDVLALTRERDTLLDQIASVRAERDALALERDTYRAQAENAATLAARVAALEAEAARVAAVAEVDAAELAGKVITTEARQALLSMAPEHRALVLSHIPATRPTQVVGHAARTETDPRAAQAAEANAKLNLIRSHK